MILATEMNAESVNSELPSHRILLLLNHLLSDTQPSSTANTDIEVKKQDRHNYFLDNSDYTNPIDSLTTQEVANSGTVQVDSRVDVEEMESISPPSSASASILSIPDPTVFFQHNLGPI